MIVSVYSVSPRLVTFTEALGSNEPVSEWDDAETALKAALHHLQHLSQGLEDCIITTCVSYRNGQFGRHCIHNVLRNCTESRGNI